MDNAREAHFQKMVKDFPTSPLGHFSLGKLYLDEGKAEQAVAPLSEAVRLAPDFAAALLALGNACMRARRLDEARSAFERARDEALKQKHATLAGEAEEQLAELEMM